MSLHLAVSATDCPWTALPGDFMQGPLECDLAELKNTQPRALRLDGRATTCSIAAALYQGLIDCDNPIGTAPLSVWLQAEGPRRVPAFVFERLFVHRLRRNHEVSDNWFVCKARDFNAPSIWFKLLRACNDWNGLDDFFARSLMSQGYPVWGAWFEGTQLWLSPFDGKGAAVGAASFLADNPCGMDVENGRVRSMLPAGNLPQNALRMLDDGDASEVNDLIRSRMFINCFLELTGGYPFDVDAIARRADGRIFAAEFKRKYPAHGGFFGVDKHLIRLPQLLDGICPLYHFILQDPRGRPGKDSDPTTLLVSAEDEGTEFSWHVLQLAPGFEKKFMKELRTRGRDSGHKGGNRTQAGIPITAFDSLSARPHIDSSQF